MKKLVMVAILVLLSSFAAASVQPDITLEKIDPQPASPGDTVKMYVVVSNDGSDGATFEPLEVETVENVNFIGTTSDFAKEFSLCSGCQKTGTLTFRVSPDAFSGEYPVDVRVWREDFGIVGKFEINVDGTPNLVVNAEEFRVAPGENTTKKLTVRNIGTDTASQVTVRSGDDSITLGPSETVFDSIPPGEEKKREIRLKADKNTESGTRNLELELSYRDENTEKSSSKTISGEVLEKAEIAISDFSVENKVAGKQTTLTVQLENLGPGEAERIVSEIKCENAEVSSAKSFVGQLGDEESVPVTFSITPRAGDVRCTLTTDYTAGTRMQLQDSFNFSAERKQSFILPVLAAILVAAAGFYYWRKRRDDELEEI